MDDGDGFTGSGVPTPGGEERDLRIFAVSKPTAGRILHLLSTLLLFCIS